MFPQDRRIDRTERPSFDRKTQVVIFDRIETGCPGSHVNRSRRGIILSRLEDGAFLPVVQRNGLHIVQREAPQVDLPVLGIAQLDAVVEHPDVLGSHAPDIDRLQSPDSAVVLDLDAGKITNGIGHRNHTQAPEFFARQLLCGNDLRQGPATVNRHFSDFVFTEYTVLFQTGSRVLCLCGNRYDVCHQTKKADCQPSKGRERHFTNIRMRFHGDHKFLPENQKRAAFPVKGLPHVLYPIYRKEEGFRELPPPHYKILIFNQLHVDSFVYTIYLCS